ncbi:hypothetical protein Golax_005418 [Gossypium laxum]|uniref:RNase H type-1 domain-containing protein n=1 Tax=Gossypium laxum TaxID=34288 RepID=A0A7J9A0M7_9ROSI|nr:hypothetical protein [Gossypium laxum]
MAATLQNPVTFGLSLIRLGVVRVDFSGGLYGSSAVLEVWEGEETIIHALKDCPVTLPLFALWLVTRLQEHAKNLGDDFRIDNLTNAPMIPKTPRIQKWEKAHLDFVKINVDTMIIDISMGVGVIAQDCDGFVLSGLVWYRESQMKVKWAEAEALREGIVLAQIIIMLSGLYFRPIVQA